MINDIENLDELNARIPKRAIQECSMSGDNYAACLKWTRLLGLKIPREQCLNLIIETGFDDNDLEDKTDEQLNIMLLWLAAWQDQ